MLQPLPALAFRVVSIALLTLGPVCADVTDLSPARHPSILVLAPTSAAPVIGGDAVLVVERLLSGARQRGVCKE